MKCIDKPKIGFDIDEVVADFMNCFLKYSNQKYGTNFSLEEVTKYHLWECGVHATKKESIREVEEFQDSEHFGKIGFIDGAKKGIDYLSNIYNIHFITSRPDKIMEKTKKFFYSNFKDNSYTFIFSGEVYGGKKKFEICKELGIEIMVEDNFQYAFGCALNGVKTFLIDKPWNRCHEKHENLVKVKNWEELLEKLK